MFNKNSFLDKLSEIGGKVIKSTASYVPAALSEDKRFSNTFAACLALLVCADFEVEEDETVAAIKFIETNQILKEMNLVLSTLEYYGNFITDLSDSFNNKPEYLLKKSKTIQKHVAVNLKYAYKEHIKNLCSLLVGANANSNERDLKAEILLAINI